ncbi:hypothetical protein [Thermoflavimicrobium daqui]|uniref:Uncharacterized protein n=1 Tax=Thermoflavimicrobium daqui TaxID=2137476 RepID=A0A364K5W9_9BACL|nr:hypothetical protein [Thermoflavimicrobium daqui]RAL25696.1 hypothetical protein DL897_06370 [Thermoflavimicrobium daqui]
MSHISANEISLLLASRGNSLSPETDPKPHRLWDLDTRAALVILWGLLVYPLLDPDLKKNKQLGWIEINQLTYLFKEYLGDAKEFKDVLYLFKHYDYIRFRADGKIIAGTGLLSAIDAAKMYKLFRTSVLSRKLIQKQNIP